MAFQIAKNPSLTANQKDFVLEGIRTLTDEVYSDNSKNKVSDFEVRARMLFSEREIFDYFSYIGVNSEDSHMLMKYVDLMAQETRAERSKVFLKATAVEKQAIWKVRMVEHLALEKLSKPQQELIVNGIEKLSDPTLYLPSHRETTNRVVGDFEILADKLFTKKDFYRLFVSLSGDTSCPLPNGPTLDDYAAIEGPNCTCYYSAWCQFVYDTNWAYCGGQCEQTTSGCGVWGTSACTGQCRLPNP